MNMEAINLKKTIEAPVQLVFEALTEPHLLKQWFTPDVIAFPREKTTAAFAIGDIDFKMLLEEMIPYSTLTWICVDGNVDWQGSQVQFLLSESTDSCQLIFSHSNLEHLEKIGLWTASWDNYLYQLKSLCEELKQN